MPWKTIIKKGYVINNELEILDIIPFSEIPIYVKEIRTPKTISRKLEDISFCKLKCLRCKRISYLKDESANRMASMFLRRKEGCSLTQQAQTTCQWCDLTERDTDLSNQRIGSWQTIKWRKVPSSDRLTKEDVKAKSESRLRCTKAEWYCLCTRCNKTKKWFKTEVLLKYRSRINSGDFKDSGCKECHDYVNPSYKHGYSKKDKYGRVNWLYKRYMATKVSCKKKGIPFQIEFEDLLEIGIPEKCPVLGIPIKVPSGDKKNSGYRTDNSPSIDKFYPELGYVKGNIQIISWRANNLKSDGTPDEWSKISKWTEKEDIKRKLEGTHPDQITKC